MIQSPNSYKKDSCKLYDIFKLGDNLLRKRFYVALKNLLTSEYYEGTVLGRIYYDIKEDGRSSIYVRQPEMENKLKREFLDVEGDVTKYLIGYTGVGKTTLVRNFFRVYNRDICEIDGNLIIYFSFYSMISANKNQGKKKLITKSLTEVIELANTYLSGKDYLSRVQEYDDNYFKEFYNFMYSNNKKLVHSYINGPKYAKKIKKSKNPNKKILDWISEENPLDYSLSQFKFSLYLYEKKYNKQFKNIVFILDDIEAKSMKYQNELIESVWHIKKCLQAYTNRKYSFKTLITLRNYSFRMHQKRQKEAFREIDKSDIILKDTVPNLSSVVDLRFQYILEHKDVLKQIEELNSYKAAKKSLDIILKRLYGQYDKMLLELTHNNIFESMTLLMRILTNKAYIGKYEITKDGAFVIEPSKYRFTNSLNNPGLPGNNEVFYALVYGEGDVYIDRKDYYLSNILHYKKNEGVDTEILGIYIIQYLKQQGICMGESNYNGLDTKEGSSVVKDILEVFDLQSKEDEKKMKQGLVAMMKYMYEGGILLQSIVEPKKEDNSFEREYADDLQIYLSLRGKCLYEMLKTNSLLLEVYRDDIDTELENNDILTVNLSNYNKIKYCLQYCDTIYKKEAIYIRNCRDKNIFAQKFGLEIPIVVLMNGIKDSISIYFTDNANERDDLIKMYNEIAKKINEFINDNLLEDDLDFMQLNLL